MYATPEKWSECENWMGKEWREEMKSQSNGKTEAEMRWISEVSNRKEVLHIKCQYNSTWYLVSSASNNTRKIQVVKWEITMSRSHSNWHKWAMRYDTAAHLMHFLLELFHTASHHYIRTHTYTHTPTIQLRKSGSIVIIGVNKQFHRLL